MYSHIPESVDAPDLNQPFTLPNDITALQIEYVSASETCLSPAVKLPRGARVEPCGRGFNSNTLKVCCEGQFYFVFAQQLLSRS